MAPYGVNPKHHQDCCPGHSRYSKHSYNNRGKAAQTRDTATAHRVARRVARLATKASFRNDEKE